MSEKIKTLQIIHLGICAGTIVFYYILGDLSIEKLRIPTIDSSSIIYVAIPVVAFVLSTFLFKSQLKQINPKLKLEEKFPIYQTASIMRWGVLEGAAFLILILKPDFILFGILILIYLIFLRPTAERIDNDLSDTNN
ncbi:MFS transporter [Flavobacterium zhairuonense]|uniref:MFS transporter n=1 Tax=Flavobacterium zhairuonense TaxID=2493631 RepID=UPI00104EDA3F|nr:MFS transporter [Flavobacterium zhairuonense]KAF2510253.1 MFS transporter [Flavobacterium zhairuonense]